MNMLIHYGCHECLRGHDEESVDVAECPHCGGITAPMPADEQPTLEARKAVAWAAQLARPLSDTTEEPGT